MTHHAGLDVSQKETTIRTVDEQGRRLWRGKVSTDPDAITQILRRHGSDLQVGVETVPLMVMSTRYRMAKLPLRILQARSNQPTRGAPAAIAPGFEGTIPTGGKTMTAELEVIVDRAPQGFTGDTVRLAIRL
jgi:transposase